MSVFARNPFFGPLVAAIAGMLAEAALPASPVTYWPALFLLMPAALAWRSPNPSARWFVAAAACFFVGGFWLSLHPLPTPPQVNTAPGERVLISGCIDSAVRTTPERVQFLLDTGNGRMQVGVFPREGERPPELAYGMGVELLARVRPPRNFGNPGSFDYQRFLARQDVFWLASSTGVESLKLTGQRCGSPALALLHRTRRLLLDRLHTRFAAHPEARAYLSAVLFGEDSQLNETAKEQHRIAGVYHTLVISGQHIAILAGFFLLAGRILPVPRWALFLLTALACWAYALIAGYEVPALRAACGVSLYFTGLLLYRQARPVNLLSVIALVFLAWDPRQILDVSFQLSFAAVLGIAGVAAPLQRKLFGDWPRIGRRLHDVTLDLRLPASVAAARVELRTLARTLWAATGIANTRWMRVLGWGTVLAGLQASLILVSVAVQVCLSPFLIAYFHRLPLLGPLANLLVSPLLGLIVPAAFIDLLLPIPGMESAIAAAIAFLQFCVGAVAVASPDWRMADPPFWAIGAAALSVLAALMLCEPWLRRRVPPLQRYRATPRAAQPNPFRLHLPRWALTTSALLPWPLLLLPPAPTLPPAQLELTMIDVGQGDAFLLVSPEGKTMLVDTGGLGGYSATPGIDTGEDVIAPYLWQRGISRLDVLALTHFDFDHAGGAPAILSAFRPRELWIPGPPESHEWGQTIVAQANQLGISVHRQRAGTQTDFGRVKIAVLHAKDDRPSPAKDSNAESMVLRVEFGQSSALLTADIDSAVEAELLEAGVLQPAQVLKVAHHGSRTSTSRDFLEAVRPQIGLVSAGWLNTFRHPHPTVVERLQAAGVAILRTDQQGAVTLHSNGNRWEWAAP